MKVRTLLPIFICLIITLSFFNFGTVKATPDTEFFNDGFESGDYSAWTGTNKDGDAILQIVTSPVHHGSKASESWVTDISADNAYAYYTDSSDYTTLYARAYFRFYEVTVSNNRHTGIIGIYGTNGAYKVAALVVVGNGSIAQWQLKYRNGGGTSISGKVGTISLNTWYCVEIKVKMSTTGGGSDGAVEFWLDGTSKLSDNAVDNDDETSDVDTVRVGITPTYAWGKNANLGLYDDCVVLADTYIGPEVGGQEYEEEFQETATITSQSNFWKALSFQQTETATITSTFYSGKEAVFIQTESTQVTEQSQFWKSLASTFTEAANVLLTFESQKESLLTEYEEVFEQINNVTATFYTWKAKTIQFTEALSIIDTFTYLGKEAWTELIESLAVTSQTLNWIAKQSTFTETINIISQMIAQKELEGEFQETFTQTIQPSGTMTIWKEKYVELTDSTSILDQIVNLREKIITLQESTNPLTTLEITKELITIFEEFTVTETVNVATQVFFTLPSTADSLNLALVLAAFAFVMAIIGITFSMLKKPSPSQT